MCVGACMCVLTLKCVYKYGAGPLGKMHNDLSISECVNQIMTGHVAFGKPGKPCVLCTAPNSQLATDLQNSKIKLAKNIL